MPKIPVKEAAEEYSKQIERYRPESIAQRHLLLDVIENDAYEKWFDGNLTQSTHALELDGL
jgi:hypothetical protein